MHTTYFLCFFPFRQETELKSNLTGSYIEKLHEPGVTDIIDRKKQQFEPFADLVD